MTGTEIARVKRWDHETEAQIVAKVLEHVRDNKIEIPQRLEVSVEFDPNHLDDVVVLRRGLNDDEINEIVRMAHSEAQLASHSGARVDIRVGQGMWDWLKDRASIDDDTPRFMSPENLWFGHSVVLEMAWQPWRVEVVSTVLVS